MNSPGEIQARSKQTPPLSSMSFFAPNRFFYLPSFDDCTFGFLEVVFNEIICLDVTLDIKKIIRVPLDWVQAGTIRMVKTVPSSGSSVEKGRYRIKKHRMNQRTSTRIVSYRQGRKTG